MSIPASVVLGGDLDTVGRLRGGRFDAPFMPNFDRPYGEGLLLTIPPYSTFGSVSYIAPFDMELHRVHFKTSRFEIKDKWSLHLNDDTEKNYIIRDYYQKNYAEGIQLMSVIPLKKGDKLTFKLNSTNKFEGLKSEISMLFLVSSRTMKGNGALLGNTEHVKSALHVSYNTFGGEHGEKIPLLELYDEAIPFSVKRDGDYYKLIDMTGTHTFEGEVIKSLAHNTTKVVKVFYMKPNGEEDSVQLKKDWLYVSVPNEIYSNRTAFLTDIEERMKALPYYENIPFRVRGIKQEYMENITKIIIT